MSVRGKQTDGECQHQVNGLFSKVDVFNAAVWPGALSVKQEGLHGGKQRLSSTKTGLAQLTFCNQKQDSH